MGVVATHKRDEGGRERLIEIIFYNSFPKGEEKWPPTPPPSFILRAGSFLIRVFSLSPAAVITRQTIDIIYTAQRPDRWTTTTTTTSTRDSRMKMHRGNDQWIICGMRITASSSVACKEIVGHIYIPVYAYSVCVSKIEKKKSPSVIKSIAVWDGQAHRKEESIINRTFLSFQYDVVTGVVSSLFFK